ncbi:Pimeloyl-ACP methyl ester carboxylesterase [Natronorubrum sediminis]|uniref:Pimeloyl-ACP methyl ester carboxylesterase n=1 Tax=Natronorubrum sediminis TaxID=640943 RepID=A0A1H6FM28_9EURY|nr:alpha/beta hydrolase [Natronorubrum sediminis]SEH10875.1 Pimeloyl-ACP methyl ester carboxylesterase [Natronorubrum sediminis]
MVTNSSLRSETGTALRSSIDAESTVRTVNDVQLHVVVAGEETGPLVVLLHGFPEYWYGWRHQLEAFVEAGFRVLVPDQRGYNLSEKPDGVRPYRLEECTRDVRALIENEGRDSAFVVGHDWGGVVAWNLAQRFPSAVDRLAIVNAPHPTVFREHLRSNPEQLRRSWYAGWFQLPTLPELVCRARDFTILERALTSMAPTGTFTDDELESYRSAWRRPGALTSMLNWYRAALRYPPGLDREPVSPPTLVVWGTDDVALTTALAIDADLRCETSRLELWPETSHWVQHERPERLNTHLLEWFDDDR